MSDLSLPDVWTPIAHSDVPAALRFAGVRWLYADGWDQGTVETLRASGRLLTAQQRQGGVMVLLARVAGRRPAGA